MPQKVLLQGNVAMAEAAIQAGCRFYAGYPITPQNEVPEYMSRRMPEVGGTFIQAEAELSAINMLFGASAAGARCMTSSSSPGISLKQEGISYIAAAGLPCLIANIQRGGPGLGNIRASQADYFQAVKGGGHGDYHLIVLAPSAVPEIYQLTMDAFDYADFYRNPAMILTDGLLGQMAEPLEITQYKPILELPQKDYVLDGCSGREPRVVKTLHLRPPDSLMKMNIMFKEKYEKIQEELQLVEQYETDDAKLIIAAYGITARIARSAVDLARDNGMKLGLVRPITLWPFPVDCFEELSERCGKFLVVEMSNGQFIEDVKLATQCRKPVEFLGIGGGWYPSPENIFAKVKQIY